MVINPKIKSDINWGYIAKPRFTFRYKVENNTLYMIDQMIDGENTSITECMEDILDYLLDNSDIFNKTEKIKIVYKDIDGVWDGVDIINYVEFLNKQEEAKIKFLFLSPEEKKTLNLIN